MTPTLRKGLKVLFTAHPGIGDKDAPVQPSAPKVVFPVRLKEHAGGMVEDQAHIRDEQIPELPAKGLLDLFLLPVNMFMARIRFLCRPFCRCAGKLL